ncbi:type I glyceraldehyde-3-phosphate dehydrogenase [Litoreibacter albidus]|uniref:type I glyceraldehyde-3-phosphate dehydrogenase n=1 Tax=Litoreibacter albidus TaxID=670155 RepID=UPI0037361F0E
MGRKRVVINGFGRIGRAILRALTAGRPERDIDIVAINDIADPHELAYLFQYDSIFGPHPASVSTDGRKLRVGDRAFDIFQAQDLSVLDLGTVDYVFECTGRSDEAAVGLACGAARVLISGPSAAAELTLVQGANDDLLADQKLISLGSCTTNAIAPVLALLHDKIGLTSAHVTTIHCYTASQPSIDTPRGGFERSRAAALSMVPTTTSASRLIEAVLPDLGFEPLISSVRVPCPRVSSIDLVGTSQTAHSAGAINSGISDAAGAIIGTISAPVVSSDMAMRPESLIVATPQTQTADRQLRVFGWYDNEWAYANRMIDAVLLI